MSNLQLRTVRFKASYWSCEETDDHELVIHVSGLTENHETVQVKVEGFTPFVYLQLPNHVKWTPTKCKAIFTYFQQIMKANGPIRYKVFARENLYYRKPMKTLFITFPTGDACKKFSYKCTKPLSIPHAGTFRGGDFKVHEHNIDPIIKLTASQKILLAGWVEVTEKIQEDEKELSEEERKFSSADIDLIASWSNIKPIPAPKDVVIRQKYCSFDIECNSGNHNSKLPDSREHKNCVFQIACVFGRLGEKERKSYLLTLFDPHDIPGVEMIRCKSEKELLLFFTLLIRKEDPDIFIGYNIIKFDWDYMISRAEKYGYYPRFMELSRIIGKRAELMKSNWSSSAYGDQSFRFPNCHGRTNVDVLIEVERNYKLPTYSLNTVSEFFLRDKKDDITPRQLFMLFQLTDEILKKVSDKKPNTRDLKLIRRRVEEIFPLRKTHGVVRELRRNLLKAKATEIKDLVREALTITGKYCVQDTMLPIDISEKLNLWTSMEEMSNVMHVPVSYLHTRGQQIKVVAQVFRETYFDNIVIPYNNNKKSDEKFQGATVFEANPGDYNNVATLDFASLYPTTMIAFNICHTTMVEDNDPIPDSECHVLSWSDHRGCLARDTPVSLLNRSEKIQNLDKDVQKVYASSENGIKLHDQIAHYEQGVKDCLALTFEDGTVLKCTPDHKILTSTGEWVEAQNLILGKDVQMAYRPPTFEIPNDFTLPFAGREYKNQDIVKLMQLFGILCSDGTMINGNTMAYRGHQLDVKSLTEDVEYLSGKLPKIKNVNYGWAIPILGKFGQAFRECPGIVRKTNAGGRSLPDFLFEEDCPEGVIAAFLSGLYGGGGHTISFSSKAKALSTISFSWTSETAEVFNKILILFERLGFHPTLTRVKKESKLCIPVDEVLRFHSTIGFAHCVHKAIRLEVGCLYLRHRESVWNQQKRIVENVRTARQRFIDKKKKYSMKKLTKDAIAKEEFVFNEYYGSQMTEYLRSRKNWSKPMFSRTFFPGPMKYMEKIGARKLFCDSHKQTKYAVHKDSIELPTFHIPLLHKEECGQLPTYDLEVDSSHSFVANGVIVHNCNHDPQKRKVEKSKILCGKHRYRFRKVKIRYDEKTGEITREGEGLMPRIERNLLATRKEVKKEMFVLDAKLAMHEGKATEDEIEKFRQCGFEITEPDSLGEKEVENVKVFAGSLNAKQLAIKVSANSGYGAFGARTGYIPLIAGAASITAMGRTLIMMAIQKIRDTWDNCKLVYGDTDSCMIIFEGTTLNEAFDLAIEASALATFYLKCWILGVDEDYVVTTKKGNHYHLNEIDKKSPDFANLSYDDKIKVLEYESIPIDLEFENMYGRFLLLTKKRYVAYIVNRKGEIIKEVKKGVVLARRDNSEYLRITYKKMAEAILNEKDESDVMNILYDRVDKLFTRQIPDTQFIIYTGITSMMNYPKMNIAKKNRENYNGKLFYIDENGDPVDDPVGPLDPRLVFPNYPQCLLALKMMRRGTDVPSNTRLEYLYIDKPDAFHQGEKAEDYTYYIENHDIENLHPDYLHYIEKQLANPATELLKVKYPREPVIYEKLDEALNRVFSSRDVSELKRSRLAKMKKYVKLPLCSTKNEMIGWGCVESLQDDDMWEKFVHDQKLGHRISPDRNIGYIFSGKDAKVEYVLDSVKKGGINDFNPNRESEVELIDVCRKWKARTVLNKIYDSHGMKKRPTKRPTQSGDKLRIGTKVMLLNNLMGCKKHTVCKVVEIREEESNLSAKNKRYTFDLVVDELSEKIIQNIPRTAFATFYIRDSTVMKDIFRARTYYRKVVDHLKEVFNPLHFDEG